METPWTELKRKMMVIMVLSRVMVNARGTQISLEYEDPFAEQRQGMGWGTPWTGKKRMTSMH